MVRRVIYNCENFKRVYYPISSHVAGRNIESTCQIFDLRDGTMSKLASRNCINLLKMGAKVAQDYYPETMGLCFVVNAPMTFVALWAIIKGFLDERTRNKIRIVGSNYAPILLEAIPAENLPDFLGGTCTCSHVQGGCMHSSAGPWQDYVVVNKRVIHKSEVVEEEKKEEE